MFPATIFFLQRRNTKSQVLIYEINVVQSAKLKYSPKSVTSGPNLFSFCEILRMERNGIVSRNAEEEIHSSSHPFPLNEIVLQQESRTNCHGHDEEVVPSCGGITGRQLVC